MYLTNTIYYIQQQKTLKNSVFMTCTKMIHNVVSITIFMPEDFLLPCQGVTWGHVLRKVTSGCGELKDLTTDP